MIKRRRMMSFRLTDRELEEYGALMPLKRCFGWTQLIRMVLKEAWVAAGRPRRSPSPATGHTAIGTPADLFSRTRPPGHTADLRRNTKTARPTSVQARDAGRSRATRKAGRPSS